MQRALSDTTHCSAFRLLRVVPRSWNEVWGSQSSVLRQEFLWTGKVNPRIFTSVVSIFCHSTEGLIVQTFICLSELVRWLFEQEKMLLAAKSGDDAESTNSVTGNVCSGDVLVWTVQ